MEAKKKYPNRILVTERSIDTDHYVFAQMLYNDGKISNLDWKITANIFKHLAQSLKSTLLCMSIQNLILVYKEYIFVIVKASLIFLYPIFLVTMIIIKTG